MITKRENDQKLRPHIFISQDDIDFLKSKYSDKEGVDSISKMINLFLREQIDKEAIK